MINIMGKKITFYRTYTYSDKYIENREEADLDTEELVTKLAMRDYLNDFNDFISDPENFVNISIEDYDEE